MWFISDLVNFAEREVRVKQYTREGRLVQGYTSNRYMEEKKIEREKSHIMGSELGVPLALVGIAGIALAVGIFGGKNKAVIKVVEEKAKIEKAVSPALSRPPALPSAQQKPITISKLPQELQELRSLYKSDPSAAMTSFYAGVDKAKPQESKLRFVQMVADAELSPKEAAVLLQTYEKESPLPKIVAEIGVKHSEIDKQIQENVVQASSKGLSKSALDKEIRKIVNRGNVEKELVAYDTYGREFASLGIGNTNPDKKQFLLLQEYLSTPNTQQYNVKKDYILGGSLLATSKNKPIGFSTNPPEQTIKDAFVYGYTTEDFERFKTKYSMTLRRQGFADTSNIFKPSI